MQGSGDASISQGMPTSASQLQHARREHGTDPRRVPAKDHGSANISIVDI